jgi:hypothetical protein
VKAAGDISRLAAASLALLPIMAVAADSPDPRRPILLTGMVAWPGAPGLSIVGNPNDDVVILQGSVPSATIGPVTVRDAYRVVYASRSAIVGRFEAQGINARVTDACIRTHADVVVVRNTHCVMTGGPQVGPVNMPFGLDIIAAKTVLVEDSSFDGFQWRTGPDRYWNGDGITIERDVAAAQFRRVSANGNTDAGFDVRPYAIMSDVSAADNCRNFRFWAGGDVGTLTSTDPIKRGGTSACSAIWMNGSPDGAPPKLHIRKLIVRMSRPGMIIEVETGPADIEIDECDIKAPAGTTMITFEKGAGEVILGRGCKLSQPQS